MHTELIWGSLFFKDKKFTIFKFILQFKQTATFNFFNWPLVFFLGLLSSVGEVLLLIPYIEGKKKVNTIQSSLTSIILLIAYKLMSKLQNKNYIKNYNKSETFESEVKNWEYKKWGSTWKQGNLFFQILVQVILLFLCFQVSSKALAALVRLQRMEFQ